MSESSALNGALRGAGLDVISDAGARGMFSSDASLYRVQPKAVVRPRRDDDVCAAVQVALSHGVPVTARGAGTSVAGNSIGPGLVLDFSRYMNRVLSVDPEARTAVVESGAVHATLQAAAKPHGLRFGPDPSTHTRCTIGGMIGNNACGSRSLAFGRTSDNVRGLELITAHGEPLSTGYGQSGTPEVRGAPDVIAGLNAVMAGNLAVARTEFGRFGRQVSGYAAQHLLPERFDLTQGLVGSEGTLALVTRAEVALVEDPAVKVVVVLGFPDIVRAGEAAPAVVAHRPTCCEGFDARLIDVLRSRSASAVPELPRGGAWLFVEFSGNDSGEVLTRAQALIDERVSDAASIVTDAAAQAALWRIREDGAGEC